MNKLSGFLLTIMLLTVSACKTVPEKQIITQPFFPAPPEMLMVPPPALETIKDGPEQ